MILRKLLFTGVALTVFISLACGQQREIKFIKYQLPNGLKVILHRDTTVPVVAVSVLYHVGSKNETAGRSGFAHFFEHLMFEGSQNIKRKDFEKYVTNAGGTYNANTTQDRTFYYEVFPSNQWKMGLWLESERMMHAKIDTIGVNTQREVVKEEMRMRYDNQPYGTFMLNAFRLAFKGTPYEMTPIGTMDDINKAKLGEFMDFYRTFYVPDNAVLSIAGDINTDSTEKMIRAYFGPIPRGTRPIPRPEVTVRPFAHTVKDTVYDNIQLPGVFEMYRMPKEGSPDYYAAKVLSVIMAGGPSSRMNKELKDKKQLALEVASFPLFLEKAGLFINLGICNSGVNPDTLQAGIDGIVHELKTSLVSTEEYQKVMNQIETQFIGSYSTMLGIAESLANYEVYFGDANLINTELARYKKVTREDIRAVADKYLVPDNEVVLYYLPKSQKQK